MTTKCTSRKGYDGYPHQNITLLEAVMYSLGVIMILFIPCMPGPSFYEPACRLTAPMLTIGILAVLLIWGGAKIGNKQRSWRWINTFLEKNADLDLDLEAIGKVQLHFKRNTNYPWNKTDEILTSVARSLRSKDPYSPEFQNPWAHEVINAYRFFKDGEGELIPTGCKK